MTYMTMCADNECPYKGMCRRRATSNVIEWRFTESPRKGDRCDMFWGWNQQDIMDNIVKGEKK